jgi:hypothetical protein
MNILTFLSSLAKKLLPFLMTAAEKAVKQLPKETQEELINISKIVEVIKQSYLKEGGVSVKEISTAILKQTGLTQEQSAEYLIAYLKQKGQEAGNFEEAVGLILADASQRTDTGLKSLWSGIVNILAATVSNIDWKMVVMGIVQAVYVNSVKGKVKI